MSGPQVSIVVAPGDAAQRLRLTLRSAVSAGQAADAPFEVVIALADAPAPTREVADALDHPRLRLSPGSAATTRAAAELAWGETVVLLKGGDLISPGYVARLLALRADAQAPVVARPAACITYGAAPSIRKQASLGQALGEGARLVFAAPFAPPLAAARALLVRLPPRPWTVEEDWAWTVDSAAEGVRHLVAQGAVHLAWSSPAVEPLSLPQVCAPAVQAPAPPPEPASEAEVATVLYARAALGRVTDAEAALQAMDRRLADLAGEKDRLAHDLAQALAERDRARRAAESLHASTSWKATAPLRALVSRLRRGGG